MKECEHQHEQQRRGRFIVGIRKYRKSFFLLRQSCRRLRLLSRRDCRMVIKDNTTTLHYEFVVDDHEFEHLSLCKCIRLLILEWERDKIVLLLVAWPLLHELEICKSQVNVSFEESFTDYLNNTTNFFAPITNDLDSKVKLTIAT